MCSKKKSVQKKKKPFFFFLLLLLLSQKKDELLLESVNFRFSTKCAYEKKKKTERNSTVKAEKRVRPNFCSKDGHERRHPFKGKAFRR